MPYIILEEEETVIKTASGRTKESKKKIRKKRKEKEKTVDDARRRLGGRADCQFVIQFGQLHLTDLFKLFFVLGHKFRIRIPR